MPPDSDEPGNEPNLELPSFGFGRKRKRARGAEEPAGESPAVESATVESTATAPERAVDDGRTPSAPVDAPRTAPAAAAAPPAPPRAARAPAAPTPARPPARPAARPPSRPVSPAAPTAPAAAAPPAAPRPAPEPAAPPEQTGQPTAGTEEDEATQVGTTQPTRRRERVEARARRRAGRSDRERPAGGALVAALPAIKPLYAAIISGALSGIAAVLLALGASRGCEAIRDTSSCGGGGGLLALIAILALEVLVGATLLKAWQIPDPVSTSFLGVGVVATIAMLVFLDQLDSPWMLLVIPLMTAAAFVLSWWVTVSFIDEHPMAGEVDAERGEPALDDASGTTSDHDSRA